MAEMILSPKKFGWAAAKVLVFLFFLQAIAQFFLLGSQSFANFASGLGMIWPFLAGLPVWLLILFVYVPQLVCGFIVGYLFAYFYNKS